MPKSIEIPENAETPEIHEIHENAQKQGAGTSVIPTTLFGDYTGSISLVGARKVT
jgi:hypothetical protein